MHTHNAPVEQRAPLLRSVSENESTRGTEINGAKGKMREREDRVNRETARGGRVVEEEEEEGEVLSAHPPACSV